MSIPWGTVVGEYRRRHGSDSYSQLQDYMDAFLRFLREEMANHISQNQQDRFVRDLVRGVFEEIATEIKHARSRLVEKTLEEYADKDDAEVDRILHVQESELIETIVDDYYRVLRRATVVAEATDEVIEQGRATLRPQLRHIREDMFGAQLASSVTRKLNAIARTCIGVIVKDFVDSETIPLSGIVLAGFGDDDLFPGYINVAIEGVYGGMLKWIERRQDQIAMPPKASIQSFAQMDNYLLAAGIGSEHFELIGILTRELLVEYTRWLVSELTDLSEEDLERNVEQKNGEIEAAVVALIGAIDTELWRDPDGPIDDTLEVVSVLPKDQLAEVAGAAISFTSLRRKISLETETVGGPTDVAVITKDDGLVWIKRKQYFEPGLNHEYYARINDLKG